MLGRCGRRIRVRYGFHDYGQFVVSDLTRGRCFGHLLNHPVFGCGITLLLHLTCFDLPRKPAPELLARLLLIWLPLRQRLLFHRLRP